MDILKIKSINKDLIDKIQRYIIFLRLKFVFKITGKKLHPELKKTTKNWIIYSYLKKKYKKFIQKQDLFHNEKHEYNNIIWWCWFQGFDAAPDICKSCCNSLKKHFPDYKIEVITLENYNSFVSLPDYIIKKFEKNIISYTHFSDLLRLELLTTYGGIWIDSTVFCSNTPSYIFNNPLFVYKSKESNDPSISGQNWFIYAEKNEPILSLTKKLLYEYWSKNNKTIHYFIFYFFMTIATEYYPKEWKTVPFFPDAPTFIMQRELYDSYNSKRYEELTKISDIHKLTYKNEQLPKNIKSEKTILDIILNN